MNYKFDRSVESQALFSDHMIGYLFRALDDWVPLENTSSSSDCASISSLPSTEGLKDENSCSENLL